MRYDTRNKFNTKEVQDVLELPRERLRSWMTAGFIIPSVRKSKVQGKKNKFSRIDVYGIALFKHLVEDLKLKRDSAAYHMTEWLEKVKSTGAPHPQSAASVYNVLIFTKKRDEIISCSALSLLMPSENVSFENYMATMAAVQREVQDQPWTDILAVNLQSIINEVEKKLSDLD